MTPDRPDEFLKPIGRRLRDVRKAVGITQPMAARLVDVSPQAWSQWERGKRLIDIVAAIKFCDRYGATLDFIYRADPKGLDFDIARKVLPTEQIFGSRRRLKSM